MAELLFELTEDHLETGLRGIPVGYCTTSTVDPEKGLHYAGRPVSELAYWDPERVIYLLYYGRDPDEQALATFKETLVRRAKLPAGIREAICRLPREGHPMALYSCALLIAGMFDQTGDYWEDCLNLVARVPELVATLINHHAGWGETPKSRPELGYMENFTQMLQVPQVNKDVLCQVLRVFNVLHYDHGGGNLSTFVGKAIASGKEDLYGSLAGAMNALAGPLHGRANQNCLAFTKETLEALGANATPEQVENHVRNLLANKQLVYGFGHAVLRVEDPRATIFYAMAEKLVPQDPLVKIGLLLRTEASRVLKENPKVSNPYPNVDAMSGTLLSAVGFSYPDYYTVLFGLSRVVGIARQVVYERTEAREGKGTPIIRPKFFFKKMTSKVAT